MAVPDQSKPSERGDRTGGRAAGFVDGFLRSPFSGIAPWVLMGVLSGPGRFEQAVSAALGLSLLVLWVGSRRGIPVHLLEVFGVAFFGVFAVIGLVAPEATIRWLELWAGELTNIALAIFAAVTLLIRRPFTLAYAKDSTPQEIWDSPVFLRVNYVITAVWAGAFFFSAAVGFYGDAVLHSSDNFWTGWILQLAGLFFAVSFTEFYPDYARAKALQEAGEPTDPPPSFARIFDWIPTFVLIAGIIGLVTDAVPDALGIALIVVGAVGAGVMRKMFPSTGGSRELQ
ncbi:MAG: hypothetical protein JWR37_4855 [Mycobacterium sp.]|jgi:hypothetical protein|nr:hypothetical protein [Mycobacterium sp.]